ncbi:MAG: hypothetical protein JWP69_2030 [Flaviaesturariibacter sp.]|nr:hypothetical protein [Flaviaesturariibacter sp.]
MGRLDLLLPFSCTFFFQSPYLALGIGLFGRQKNSSTTYPFLNNFY